MADLRWRIAFTLGALAAYRLGVHIPVPGIDPNLLWIFFCGSNPFVIYEFGVNWTLLERLPGFSVFGLGVVPYLAAAVLMRLASAISPKLKSLENRSEADRRKIVQVTRLLAIMIAAVQAAGLAIGLGSLHGVFPDPSPSIWLGAAATMTAGFAVVMWLCEQITLRGIGNGVALVLFADVAANIPNTLGHYYVFARTGALTFELAIVLLLLSLAVVAGIVFVERSVRHVHVTYQKRDVGDLNFGGQTVSIPLKLNNGGVIPAVIATWVLTHALYLFVIMTHYIADYPFGFQLEPWMMRDWLVYPGYMAAHAGLIIAMTYIYTVALLDPGDIARSLQDKGALVLDAVSGFSTERAFRRLIRTLSLVGGVYLAVVYVLPDVIYNLRPALGQFGGIGFLIAVAVSMDTLSDLAHRRRGHDDGKPPSDACATAKSMSDQARIDPAGLNAGDR